MKVIFLGVSEVKNITTKKGNVLDGYFLNYAEKVRSGFGYSSSTKFVGREYIDDIFPGSVNINDLQDYVLQPLDFSFDGNGNLCWIEIE